MKIRHWFSKRWVKISIVLAFLVLFAVLFYRPILMGIGDFLVVTQQPRKSDAIRILGGQPERYIYGIKLYRRKLGSRLLLSMHEKFDPLLQRTNAEIVKDFARTQGIPKSAVSIFSTESTYEEAKKTERLVKNLGLDSLLVVSSPFHMRRVSMTFRRIIEDNIDLTFVAVPFQKSKYERTWWLDEDSISAIVHEYVTLCYYWLNYFAPF